MRNMFLELLIVVGICAPASATEFVKNGGFEMSSVGSGQKKTFLSANEQFWDGGFGPQTYVGAPGTADNSLLSPYVRSPFPATSPTGGNFVMSDGATDFSYGISQNIAGLTVGTTYTLSFYQAAAQVYNFTGATTEWWDVTFGSSSLRSTIMNTPSEVFTPWQLQTMTFKASATNQTLSFFAGGGPQGGPPISFLDGVSLVDNTVPEPKIWAMMVLGFGLVGTAMRRRRSTFAAA